MEAYFGNHGQLLMAINGLLMATDRLLTGINGLLMAINGLFTGC